MKKFILNNSLNLSFIIRCGFFNCHMAGVKTDKSSKILGDIFRQLEITDLSKEKQSKLMENTCCDANNIPKSRIDYIL